MNFVDVDGVIHCLGQPWLSTDCLAETIPRVFLLCGKEIVSAAKQGAQTSCLNCLTRGEVAEVQLRPGL
jgi:hypothetical protein